MTLDSCLTFERHITDVCRSAYYQLRVISKIRHSITKDACRMLVQSLVISKLDFQNALYVSLPDKFVKRLQRVQNYAARLICCKSRRDHITPVLRELHWLPVRHRISYKILVLVYQCIHKMAPVYLQELIQVYAPSRHLRSANQLLLKVPRVRYRSSERAFTVAGPALWNDLPVDVRQSSSLLTFKRRLKTHLFKTAYL